MSRKHNTKHNRTPSSYPKKLRTRGTGSQLMPFIDSRGRKGHTPGFIHKGGLPTEDAPGDRKRGRK